MRVPNRLVNFVPIQLRTIFSIIWPASIRTDLFQASPLDRILSPKESLRQRHREAYTDSSWSPCTMNISFNNTESNLYCPCTIQYIQKIVHRNSRSVVSIGKATLSSAVIASSSALLYAAKNIWLCQNQHTKTKGKKNRLHRYFAVQTIFCFVILMITETQRLYTLAESAFNSTSAYDSWVETFVKKLLCNIEKFTSCKKCHVHQFPEAHTSTQATVHMVMRNFRYMKLNCR